VGLPVGGAAEAGWAAAGGTAKCHALDLRTVAVNYYRGIYFPDLKIFF
jgi:hypothetical protein